MSRIRHRSIHVCRQCSLYRFSDSNEMQMHLDKRWYISTPGTPCHVCLAGAVVKKGLNVMAMDAFTFEKSDLPTLCKCSLEQTVYLDNEVGMRKASLPPTRKERKQYGRHGGKKYPRQVRWVMGDN